MKKFYKCDWCEKKIYALREHTPQECAGHREYQDWLDTLEEHRFYFEDQLKEVA